MSVCYLIRKASLRIRLFQYSPFTRLYCHAANESEWDPQPWLSLDMKHKIESKWKQHVDSFGLTDNDSCPTTYILSMFPYPSGNLHMGHVRVYTISDTLARFYRMLGHNVLHPMGWDAFGLPAENAALQSGKDPAIWTENNINTMKSQLKQLGCSFDWDREFATCHPEYYKWTQYIFLQMYKAGLIYRKPSLVNWDPVDKTVLADEQVDESGNSWRSGAKVEKILLTQWFVRATKFSSNLLQELSNFQTEDWSEIVNLQKSWIGDVNGVSFDWIVEGKLNSVVTLPVWTNKPEDVHDVGFIAIQPGSMLDVMQGTKTPQEYQFTTADGNEETFKAARLDFDACNPFSQEKVPIYVVDGILPFPDGSSSYMGVPSKNHIDSIFAKCLRLPVRVGSSKIEDSSVESICKKAQKMGFGGFQTSSKLKDWLISRQRYWGTPIPIVHCSECGTVPVPEELLPVKLPPFPSKRENCDHVASPLSQAEEWVNTTCPRCGGLATRETDTMDTFVDSSWYYLRFIDPFNENQIVSSEKAKKFMPVSVYIGGKEHGNYSSLYYARIVSHFLYQLGIAPCPEPFQRLLVQGMVMGQTFLEESTGRFLKRSEVDFQGKSPFCKATGKPVVVKWDKMSKSKHNGVDPADAVGSFGVDSTRLLMLADAAPFSQRNWDPEGSKGVFNWQNNLYVLVSHFISIRQQAKLGKLKADTSSPAFIDGEKQLYVLRNESLSIITHNYKNTHQFFISIKSMQTLTKKLKLLPQEIVAFSPKFEEAMAMLITTLAPMAPHFASELWRGLALAPRLVESSSGINWGKPVLHQPWPQLDPEYHLPVTIYIKSIAVCCTTIPYKQLKDISKDTLLQVALQQERIQELLRDKTFEAGSINIFDIWGANVNLRVPALRREELNVLTNRLKKAPVKQNTKKSQISS
ncbi:probable leucine--tRNA ligase, mitochondrial [Thrips palmi]|uniref:leucine--tRNA ligase n=1 Tax=Thrips palmi TaxID=161013 RepID=A0A6P8YCJ8_THRPL|nr:probable leucine--tRNA ligase, mitochondrial [Thrips palmi]